MVVFSTNSSLTDFQVGYLALFRLFFFCTRRLRVVLDGNSLQEYAINAAVSQGPIRCPTLFLAYINDISDYAISSIAIYADDTILCSQCDRV